MSDGGKGKRGRGKPALRTLMIREWKSGPTHPKKLWPLKPKWAGHTHSLGILGRLVWLSRVWVPTIGGVQGATVLWAGPAAGSNTYSHREI